MSQEGCHAQKQNVGTNVWKKLQGLLHLRKTCRFCLFVAKSCCVASESAVQKRARPHTQSTLRWNTNKPFVCSATPPPAPLPAAHLGDPLVNRWTCSFYRCPVMQGAQEPTMAFLLMSRLVNPPSPTIPPALPSYPLHKQRHARRPTLAGRCKLEPSQPNKPLDVVDEISLFAVTTREKFSGN